MGNPMDMFGGGGDDAAQASISASEIQAQYQREALDYLKETEALPQEFREGALKQIAGAYGVEGGEGSQQEMIDRAMASPLYGALMGGQEAGEEAILRNASATGGLRSGNAQSNLADYNTQLQNQALLQSYNTQMQGLQGLAGLPSMAPQIAQQTSAIGTTLGQGQIAAAQAQQTASQQGFGNIMGMGQLGLQAYSAFSDRRLKKNIKLVGDIKGIPWYTWTWNKVGGMLGLEGECQGTMADTAYQINKKCVTIRNGFLFVNYQTLGVLGG